LEMSTVANTVNSLQSISWKKNIIRFTVYKKFIGRD
jgi:hypothetical protein